MKERIRPSDEVVQENIKRWNIPQPEQEYTVLIHCSTYNHGEYIKDALEGFVMQKCTYSFCAIIIDDCSTDNSPEMIRKYAEEYPDIIKPILLGKNHMQRGILRDPYFEKWHQRAKYIAQCEGDDHWIDPNKLQKQVDYLEGNRSVNICTHNAFRQYPDGKKVLFNKNVKTGVYSLSQCLLKGWFTPTASFLYRNNYTRSPLWEINGCSGDMAELYSNLLMGDLYYSDEVMSVYNYGTPGSMTNKRYVFKISGLIIASYVKQFIRMIVR